MTTSHHIPYCGIDFGTSNSTIGVFSGNAPKLAPLEGDHVTLPSTLFFDAHENRVLYGRSAIAAYVDGEEGRLMRSLKSVLGSALVHETTRIRASSLTFKDIIGRFVGHLKARLDAHVGKTVEQIVIGRPVRFVESGASNDADAQGTLESIARAAGFKHVAFQYEPIAAALDYEQSVTKEELVLIVDIGGGTSDFSVARLAPGRAQKGERKNDILANAGVRVGGTDFDRLLSLSAVMPELGLGSLTEDGKRNLPVGHYHDLATYHRINALYRKGVMTELRQIRWEAARRDLVDRLILVVEKRLGHKLALSVERAKIDLSTQMRAEIGLDAYGDWGTVEVTRKAFDAAIAAAVARVADTAQGVVGEAAIKPSAIQTIFMTGGSSSIPCLRAAILALFPAAAIVDGDMFGSVGLGLAIDARRKFG